MHERIADFNLMTPGDSTGRGQGRHGCEEREHDQTGPNLEGVM